MLSVRFQRLELVKRFPLTISRGTMASSENLFVFVSDGRHEGVGELSPATGKAWTAERGEAQLSAMLAEYSLDGQSPYEVWAEMKRREVDPPAMAALDMALWDLLGKQAGLPLYRIFGFPKPTVPTSVTIGINPADVTRERVPIILETSGAKCLKIKLGSPEGIAHDQAHFEAAREAAAPFGVRLRVDANGGWSVDNAKTMMKWLADRGVDYVEQPLVEGAEADLPRIFEGRPLPIFVDESCRFATDVPKVAHAVDGVNLKLMKCGGPTDALRIIAAAQAHGLQTMIGCMSESSVAIAAGAALSGVLTHIDLDSHTNLNPDPATGAPLVDGVVVPQEAPGHGAGLVNA